MPTMLQYYNYFLTRINICCMRRVSSFLPYLNRSSRCNFILCTPTGGKCKLSLNSAWRRKGDWSNNTSIHEIISSGLSKKNLKYTLLSLPTLLLYTFININDLKVSSPFFIYLDIDYELRKVSRTTIILINVRHVDNWYL